VNIKPKRINNKEHNIPSIAMVGGCIQKCTDWPPGATTANGTAFCHQVQLFRYFVSQSSEFYRRNHLCCFSTRVYCCCLFRYRLSTETFGHTLAHTKKKDYLTKHSSDTCYQKTFHCDNIYTFYRV